MKVTVKNLEPLSEVVIDLKPLTIFVGSNNTGKTRLAHTLARIYSSSARVAFVALPFFVFHSSLVSDCNMGLQSKVYF